MAQTVVFVGDSPPGGRWNEWFPEYEVRNLAVSGLEFLFQQPPSSTAIPIQHV